MFNIFIQGLKDGEHQVEMEVPVEEVPEMFGEYFGIINLKGKLKKIGNRFTLFANADCMAKMICDMTLEEFTEKIQVEVNLSFVAENKHDAAGKQPTSESKREASVVGIKISSDGKFADIADEIREIFAVSLPMKRVAPQYRDKNFEEIFPEYDSEKNTASDIIDERWAPLKKINSN